MKQINKNVILPERVNLQFMFKWEQMELNYEVPQLLWLKAWPITFTQHQYRVEVFKRKSPKIRRNSCLNQGDMQLLKILFLPLFSNLFTTANKIKNVYRMACVSNKVCWTMIVYMMQETYLSETGGSFNTVIWSWPFATSTTSVWPRISNWWSLFRA